MRGGRPLDWKGYGLDGVGWVGMSARAIEVDVNGQTHRVTVERIGPAGHRYRVSWGRVTRVVDARQLDQDVLSLVIVEGGSASHEVRCVSTPRPGELELLVAGRIVHTRVDSGHERFSAGAGQGAPAGGEQEVTAPMPGKVVRVLVQPGDEVDAEQGVVVIEAMKMENELRAPSAGRVKEVSVEAGMSVEVGRVLLVIA